MIEMSKRETIFRLSFSAGEDTIFVFFTSFGSVEGKLVALLDRNEIDGHREYPQIQFLLSDKEHLNSGETSYKDLLQIADHENTDLLLLKDVCVRNAGTTMRMGEICLFLDDVKAITLGPLNTK